MNPYEVLGCSPSDNPEDIKSAYRKLAMENHPDKGGDPERMKEINAAYEAVSNGSAVTENISSRKAAPNEWGSWDFMGVFASIFPEGLFNNRPKAPRSPGMRLDLSNFIHKDITLDDFAKGPLDCSCVVRMRCPECMGNKGEGHVCDKCGGDGAVRRVQMVGNIEIGIADGCSDCGGLGFILTSVCDHCHGEGVIEQLVDVKYDDFDFGVGAFNPGPMEFRTFRTIVSNQGYSLELGLAIKEGEIFKYEKDGSIICERTVSLKDVKKDAMVEVPKLRGGSVMIPVVKDGVFQTSVSFVEREKVTYKFNIGLEE